MFVKRIFTGVFSNRDCAERAYNILLEHGYAEHNINLIMSDETQRKLHEEEQLEPAFNTGRKSQAMAMVKEQSSLKADIVIPSIGLAAAGPLAGALVKQGIGGRHNSISSTLSLAGIPDARALLYESRIRSGKIVIAFFPRDTKDARVFEEDWRRNGGEEIFY